MAEDKSKELEKFKKLLQYFLLHLEYNHWKYKNEQEEAENKMEPINYPWPQVDIRIKSLIEDGKKSGRGYNDDAIQNQIKEWCYYSVGKICISVRYSPKGGYSSKASYLHWPGTGLNINAEWDEEKNTIKSLFFRDADEGSGQQPSYFITRDELFSDKSPHLEGLYDHYIMVKKQSLNKLLEKSHNIILTGAPGTGKTFLAKQIAEQVGATGNRCGFVQFHPSYDYTDFIEGLRPVKVKGSNAIEFQRKDGVFLDFCRKALAAQKVTKKNEPQPMYVFIIDEINRGEISKIFGELFFSIDNGYRGIKGLISTQYSNLWEDKDCFDNDLPEDDKKKFYVPDNVYIIGTMNDIDRSVESLDFAFRRRFTFHEITAEDSEIIIYSAETKDGWDSRKRQNAVSRMKTLNKAIVDKGGLTEQYQIGGAYYLKLKDVGFDFNRFWNEYLRGTLYEYFRGLPSKEIKEKLKILKEAYDNSNDNGDDDDN